MIALKQISFTEPFSCLGIDLQIYIQNQKNNQLFLVTSQNLFMDYVYGVVLCRLVLFNQQTNLISYIVREANSEIAFSLARGHQPDILKIEWIASVILCTILSCLLPFLNTLKINVFKSMLLLPKYYLRILELVFVIILCVFLSLNVFHNIILIL